MSEPSSPIPTSTLEYYHALPRPVGRPPRPRYWLHLLLVLATFFTTLVMGARMQYNFDHNHAALSFADDSLPFFPASWYFSHPAQLWAGWRFAVTLMLFFLSHEMGHYLLCRRYGIHATLPFFIPAPTPIGTMGAVILIRSKIHSRAALFDIGIAGPIAGFVVALVILVFSLGWAKPAPYAVDPNDIQIGMPLIFDLVHKMWALLSPTHSCSTLPLGRLLLHPASIAAWVGMYATALNLLPSSQLDGGHIVYALAPRAHRAISWLMVLVLLYLGRHHMSWRVWAGIILAMNVLTYRFEQAPQYPGLPANRWLLAVLAGIMLLLTFTVSPFQVSW